MATGKVRKAVIPAAGLGTRFYPLTRAQPKEMLPVLDKPIIHYVVEEAVNSGLDEILIVVGAGKDSIINYFDSNTMDGKFANHGFEELPDIYFVRQKKQLGLADSIKYAEKFVDGEPFVVLLGDTIYRSNTDKTVLSQIRSTFDKWGSPTIAIEKVPRNKIGDYGIVSGTQLDTVSWEITSLVEKPRPEEAPSDMGITGTYILTESIFPAIRKLKPGKNGEYQLTDALSIISNEERLVGSLFSGTRYDIGTKELWVRAFFEFAKDDERFRHLIS